MTALDMQWLILEHAQNWASSRGLSSVGEDVGEQILQRWEQVLNGLEQDPLSLASQVDWVAKYRLFQASMERHSLDWSSPRLAAMDLQYHDLRAATSLSRRMGLERLTTDAQVDLATTEPPPQTRAYFRGRCLARFPDEVVAANWDSLVFDIGEASLQRVPMLEPGRGTQEAVGALIDSSADAAELLQRLK
jgi:proteasome accessory factor A